MLLPLPAWRILNIIRMDSVDIGNPASIPSMWTKRILPSYLAFTRISTARSGRNQKLVRLNLFQENKSNEKQL